MHKSLPAAFADLEPLVSEWAIADGHARYLKRVGSSQEALEAFYRQLFPRAAEAIAWLDERDVSEPLPPEACNLLHLIYMLITASLAVEVWKQPRVVDSADILLTRVDSGY